MNEPQSAHNEVQPAPTQRWLAYELHDGLLQWVVGARMLIDAAITNETEHDLSRLLQLTRSHLEAALEEGRQLIAFLELEPTPSNVILKTALTDYIDAMAPEAERNDQQIFASIHLQSCPALSQATTWNLLRIAQQALRNAMQHAGPSRIDLDCSFSPDAEELKLTISDDGTGFDPSGNFVKAKQFGLSSMHHRAKLMGASLRISSAPRAGCTIACSLPVSHREGDAPAEP